MTRRQRSMERRRTSLRSPRSGTRSTLAVTATAVALLAGAGMTPASADTPSTTPDAAAHYSTGTPAPTTSAVPAPSDTPRLPDGYGTSPSQDAAMQSAATKAQASGKPVAVEALTTPEQQITAQPDGGFELSADAAPVRTKQAGHWAPVDTELRKTSSGTLAPAATAYGTVAFSEGGSDPLVTSRYKDVTVTVKWPGSLPSPVVKGSTATYSDVFPSVDLVVTATPSGGFTDTLIVKSAAAATNPALSELRLNTRVTGGTLSPAGGGGATVRDSTGKSVMSDASPLMWDSNTKLPATSAPKGADVAADSSDAAHPGLAAHVAPVGLTTTASKLTLKPNKKLLTKSSTVYPVYIDPTFNWHPYDPSAPAFDEVKQGCPSSKFYDNSGDLADGGRLGVGYNGWPEGACNRGDEHAIYQWKLSSTIFGAHINSATVKATEVYSASCSGDDTVNLHWSGGIGSGTDWSNRPKYNSYATSAKFARAWNPTYCSSNGSVSEGLNVLTPIRKNAASHAGSFTATLSEDSMESSHNDLGFSRFSKNPSLQIEYNTPPSVPSASSMSAVAGADDAPCDTTSPYPYMGKTIASTPPVLRTKVSDKNGDKLQATFQYWVSGSSTKATGKSGDNLKSGSTASFSLPSTFVKALKDGQTVDWQAQVTDGEDTTPMSSSPTCHFTAETTAPDAPSVTSEGALFPNTDDDGGVGAAAGTQGTFDVTSSGGGSATKFVYGIDVPPATSNPPASATVAASGGAAKVKITPVSPGPHTLWVYAVDAAGDDSGATGYPFMAAGNPSTTCTSLTACFDNIGITADSARTKGNFDGAGDSFSATDLTNGGWTSGGRVTIDGATFKLPAFGSGQKDNVVAGNQTITFSGNGSALEFLASSSYSGLATPGAIAGDRTAPYVPESTKVSASYCFDGTTPQGPCAAHGTINYTDGTKDPYFLTVPDWRSSDSSIAALAAQHYNSQTKTVASQHQIYAFSVPVDTTKKIASVTLPDVSSSSVQHEQALHIFGMATRDTTNATAKADGTTAAAPAGQSWTGAWANPTEGQYNFQGGDFSDQTFRIALKPSLSGSTVRVKLDNALGTSKLSIGHVTVATDAGSGAPSPLPKGTPTTLKFGGSQTVTIPEGGSVYSDPLSFSVTAGQYLLVSFQLSNSVPYLVQHSFANNAYQYQSAIGSGDKTTDTTGTPFAEQWEGWYTDLVTNVDVTTAHTPTQAVLGDGLVDPFQPNTHPVTNGRRVSDALSGAEPTTPAPFGTIAEGIEANSLMKDNPEIYNGHAVGGPSVLSRIDRDLLDQPGVSNVLVTEGLQDLLAGSGDQDLEANGYTALVQQLKGWNISTTLASLTPCDGYTGSGASPDDPCSATVDTARTSVNDWLNEMPLGTPWDDPSISSPVYYADFDSALAVTDATNGEEKLSSKADTGDHVNLTNSGYAAETDAILSPHNTWALDDGTGLTSVQDTAPTDTPSTINDTTGVGSDPLSLGGTTSWTDDPARGETLTLDGASGFAAGTTPALDTSGSYSVSAWVNLTSLPGGNATIASQDGSVNSPFALQYDGTSKKWTLSLTKSDTVDSGTWKAAGTAAKAGAWTHLVGTYDATTHTARLYVNGALAGTATGVTSWKSANAFTIGRDLGNGTDSDYLPGQLSDVQAWNYTLGPDQVTALYQELP